MDFWKFPTFFNNTSYTIFCIEYQQRPDIYDLFFPYEFSSKVNKINNTCCNQFHQNHPQYEHSQFIWILNI